jgi:hypothetical protein
MPFIICIITTWEAYADSPVGRHLDGQGMLWKKSDVD